MKCQTEGCEGRVEADAPIWFTLDDDGAWSIFGVNDHSVTFTCDHHEHQNYTKELYESLVTYLESILPGSTSGPAVR